MTFFQKVEKLDDLGFVGQFFVLKDSWEQTSRLIFCVP